MKSIQWICLTGLLAAALLAGCAGAGEQDTNGEAAPQATAVETTPTEAAEGAPEDGAEPAAATPAIETGVTFRNPVTDWDFPDPHILLVDGRYYGYATNSSLRNVQVAVSDNLVDWELVGDAMPDLPAWTVDDFGFVWAPEVIQIGDQFVLYYTARYNQAERQCIGVAVSATPEGPFQDTRDEPLICQISQGGSIDASPFRDGDRLYLYWKNDGNCCGMTTHIYGQALSADGLSLEGEPSGLISNNRRWEGPVVEAPVMLEHEGAYYLFYSGNVYSAVEYAIGYAVCETPLGLCEDAEENPILKSVLRPPPVIGPGHNTFVEVDGQTWMVYHAWEVTSQGQKTDSRFMWLDRVDWIDGKPVVQGPTTGVQPVPIPDR